MERLAKGADQEDVGIEAAKGPPDAKSVMDGRVPTDVKALRLQSHRSRTFRDHLTRDQKGHPVPAFAQPQKEPADGDFCAAPLGGAVVRDDVEGTRHRWKVPTASIGRQTTSEENGPRLLGPEGPSHRGGSYEPDQWLIKSMSVIVSEGAKVVCGASARVSECGLVRGSATGHGRYGVIEHYTRLSRYVDWIEQTT
jgi:hypothetical protein